MPQSILYDNTKIAVARILGDGKRERTRGLRGVAEPISVCGSLWLTRQGERPRPGLAGGGRQPCGKVEGLVKLARRNFMVPLPRAADFDRLNERLHECCLRRQEDHAGRHSETIGSRLAPDIAALRALPAAPFEACETVLPR